MAADLPLHTREGERSRCNVAILMMFEAESTEEQYRAINDAMGIMIGFVAP